MMIVIIVITSQVDYVRDSIINALILFIELTKRGQLVSDGCEPPSATTRPTYTTTNKNAQKAHGWRACMPHISCVRICITSLVIYRQTMSRAMIGMLFAFIIYEHIFKIFNVIKMIKCVQLNFASHFSSCQGMNFLDKIILKILPF